VKTYFGKQAIAVLAGLAVSLTVVPAAYAADDAVSQRIIDYFRRKQNLPPNVQAKLTDIRDSKLGGGKEATLELSLGARKQSVNLLMSDDGKYVAFAAVEDVTKDPFAEVAKKITTKGQPAKGPKDAVVTIVEFSDFQCPYCARAHKTVSKDVLPAYEGKVRFVYKTFPLSFHKWAKKAAVASDCAFEQSQDAFWKLYDYYFEHQRELNETNIKEKTIEALKGEKFDVEKFGRCVDEEKTAARVKKDMDEGQSVGVTGTPAFIINGRTLSGAQPAQKFKAIIDDELARAAKGS